MEVEQNASQTYSISDRFTAEKLMLMISKDKLEELEQEFERHPKGLPLQTFVSY
jgi:hypothetical protein